MKKEYVTPGLEVVSCPVDDVIHTSPIIGEDTETDYGPIHRV